MPRFFFPAATIAVALSCAVPAHAADLSTIGCVGDKLDDAAREKIAGEVANNLEQATARNSFSPEVTKAVRDAAVACAGEHGWNAAAGRPAMLYTLARLSLPTVQRIAGERGLDTGLLESLWFALPEEQRDKPLTVETYRQLADAAIPEGEGRTQANGALLRTFFEFQSLMQSASVDFSRA